VVLHTCVRACLSVASMSVAADRRFATPSTITPGKTNVAKRAHSAALRLPAIPIMVRVFAATRATAAKTVTSSPAKDALDLANAGECSEFYHMPLQKTHILVV
jgi:hypothetical protein